MRRLTLLAILAVAGCGEQARPPQTTLIARAGLICQNAAVPAIPLARDVGGNMKARLAELALGQERREVRRLRLLDWSELESALASFDRALPHLDAYVRSRGRADRERATYGRLIDRWRGRAADVGLDLCSRYGFAY